MAEEEAQGGLIFKKWGEEELPQKKNGQRISMRRNRKKIISGESVKHKGSTESNTPS